MKKCTKALMLAMAMGGALPLSVNADGFRSMVVTNGDVAMLTINLEEVLNVNFTTDSLVIASDGYQIGLALADVTGWHYSKEWSESDPAFLPPGDGSWNAPSNVAALRATAGDERGKWVTGYIVGSYTGTSVQDYANFSDKNHVAANVLLAPKAGVTDLGRIVPVQLPYGAEVRGAVNLLDNPDNYGREVSVLGDISTVGGMRGVKNTSKFAWGPKGYDDSAIDGVTADAEIARDGNTLTVSGLNAGHAVRVVDMAGRMVMSPIASDAGIATVSLDGLMAGAYVISYAGKSIKIVVNR